MSLTSWALGLCHNPALFGAMACQFQMQTAALALAGVELARSCTGAKSTLPSFNCSSAKSCRSCRRNGGTTRASASSNPTRSDTPLRFHFSPSSSSSSSCFSDDGVEGHGHSTCSCTMANNGFGLCSFGTANCLHKRQYLQHCTVFCIVLYW